MSFEINSEAVNLSALYHLHETVVNVRLSGGTIHHGLCDWVASACLSVCREEYSLERIPHHSVQISIRYADNIVTLYRLRRPSGRPADYT